MLFLTSFSDFYAAVSPLDYVKLGEGRGVLSFAMDRFLQGVFIDFKTQTCCFGVRATIPFLAGLGCVTQSSR